MSERDPRVKEHRKAMRMYRASLKKFGYAVIQYDPDLSWYGYPKGSTTNCLWGKFLSYSFVVIGAASRADWNKQIALYLEMFPDKTAPPKIAGERFRKLVRKAEA